MDRLIYTAMTGAKHVLTRQASTAHNLSNVSTAGFRAQVDAFRAVPVLSDAMPTRAFVVNQTTGSDFSPGGVRHTGRDLDVAVSGNGWLAVRMPDGREAYTRDGRLSIGQDGTLQGHGGLPIVGTGGPISVPPGVTVSISSDGTVSGIATGLTGTPPTVIGQLKRVDPQAEKLVRGPDGLFRPRDGRTLDAAENVTVTGGALEGSNVNVAETLIDMIAISRQFEMHMKLLQNAESNGAKAAQILSVNG